MGKVEVPELKIWKQFSREARTDFVVDNDLWDEISPVINKKFGELISRNDLVDYTKRRINAMINGTVNDCHCPICTKAQGYQHKSLNDGTIEFAWVLYNLSMEIAEKIVANTNNPDVTIDYLLDNHLMPSFHYDDDDTETGKRGIMKFIYECTKTKYGKGRKPTGRSILKFWGVVEEDESKGKLSGWFRPNRTTHEFFTNDLVLPKEIWIHNNKVVKESDKKYTWAKVKLIPYKDRLNFRKTYFN